MGMLTVSPGQPGPRDLSRRVRCISIRSISGQQFLTARVVSQTCCRLPTRVPADRLLTRWAGDCNLLRIAQVVYLFIKVAHSSSPSSRKLPRQTSSPWLLQTLSTCPTAKI